MRAIRDAVVELSEVAFAHQRAEAPEAAALFGDGHCEHGLALLAELGAFGHEAQAIEVHVGATGTSDLPGS
jgi:hypothetical protein